MRITVLALCLLLPGASAAGELLDGFRKALLNDPTYLAAKAEFDGNMIESEKAGRAYWPEVGFRMGERSEVQGMQRTFQLSQPLVDVARYVTSKGAQPLENRARATMRQREADLIQRYYTSVSELVKAREQVTLNTTKIDALEQQAKAAERGFALGVGTVTDVADTRVRLAQARADAVNFKARLEAAERQYQALTGEAAAARGFGLTKDLRSVPMPTLQTMFDLASSNNPQLISARQNQRLADLNLLGKYGAFAPKLNLIARQTQADSRDSSYVGVAIEFPLQSGSLLDVPAAKAGLVKASEEVKAAELKARLEVQRLYALVEAGRAELPIRAEAIKAAEEGVRASEGSFKGGVRSKVDVLNAIQTLFQVRNDYVTAVLSVGLNFISLQSVVDAPSVEVLEQVERLLF